MNTYNLSIFNHSGSLLVEQEISSGFLPRVGEIITLNEELDNTNDFIVTDVSFEEQSSSMFIPRVSCESFYKKGGHTRLFHLRQNCWVPGHCSDVDEEKR